jgi:hypothetical protein
VFDISTGLYFLRFQGPKKPVTVPSVGTGPNDLAGMAWGPGSERRVALMRPITRVMDCSNSEESNIQWFHNHNPSDTHMLGKLVIPYFQLPDLLSMLHDPVSNGFKSYYMLSPRRHFMKIVVNKVRPPSHVAIPFTQQFTSSQSWSVHQLTVAIIDSAPTKSQ